jgi:hypothetical protein
MVLNLSVSSIAQDLVLGHALQTAAAKQTQWDSRNAERLVEACAAREQRGYD